MCPTTTPGRVGIFLAKGRVAHPVNLLVRRNLHERVPHPAFFWRGGGVPLENQGSFRSRHQTTQPVTGSTILGMPVDDELFLSHVNIDDPLKMVLRCHQDFDALLTEIVNKVLVESHHLEVERIPFPLKVELAGGPHIPWPISALFWQMWVFSFLYPTMWVWRVAHPVN